MAALEKVLDVVARIIMDIEAQIRETGAHIRAQEQKLVDAVQRGTSDAVTAIYKEHLQYLRNHARGLKDDKREWRLHRSTYIAIANQVEANRATQAEVQRVAVSAGANLLEEGQLCIHFEAHRISCHLVT